MRKLLLFPFLLLSAQNYAQNCVETISMSDVMVTIRTQDGSLYTWGANQFGQFGNGAVGLVTTPTPTVNGDQWAQISHARMHTVALDHDNNLWSWGNNVESQLGNGSSDPHSYVPVNTNSGTDWVTISAGNLHAIGLKSDGTLWGWGNNGAYELSATGTDFSVPAPISDDTDWNKVYAGYFKTFAIKNDGTLWGRGRNNFLDVGTGPGQVLSFTQIGTANNWVKISCARAHATLGLRSDNTLWAWGDNENGRLGDGTVTNRPTPVQIAGQWKDMAMGTHHAIAIKTDGTLWQWGSYGWIEGGMLIPNSSVPVQVGTDNDWVSVSAGASTSFALKADNSLWGWGFNTYGYLGNGANVSPALPIQIIDCNLMGTPDAAQNALTIYPNPVADVLHWNANGDASYRIVNALGQQIQSGTALSGEISVSALSKGMYLLVLESADGKSRVTKFIKE